VIRGVYCPAKIVSLGEYRLTVSFHQQRPVDTKVFISVIFAGRPNGQDRVSGSAQTGRDYAIKQMLHNAKKRARAQVFGILRIQVLTHFYGMSRALVLAEQTSSSSKHLNLFVPGEHRHRRHRNLRSLCASTRWTSNP
jgi:hypothetical protein